MARRFRRIVRGQHHAGDGGGIRVWRELLAVSGLFLRHLGEFYPTDPLRTLALHNRPADC